MSTARCVCRLGSDTVAIIVAQIDYGQTHLVLREGSECLSTV